MYISRAANTFITTFVEQQRSAFEFALNFDQVENFNTERKVQGKGNCIREAQ